MSPWADWSWAVDTLSNPSPVSSGTSSVAVTFGAWQGLYFQNPAFSTTGWTAATLRVHGGTGGGGAALNVRAVVNGAFTNGTALGPTCDAGAVVANAWTTCTVPLSAIAPAGATITGLVIQEGAGVALPPIYFDEIGFTSSATSPPPAQTVVVTISPTTSALASGATQQFTASVTGTSDVAVTWTIQEGAAGGTIGAGGLYVAPSTAGTYHVVATSHADSTTAAVSTVTVTAPPPPPPPATVSIAVSPVSGNVDACQTLQLIATVNGASDASVTWALQESAGGTVSASGLYTAPAAGGTYHAVATSHADPTKSAVATVTVTERIVSVAVAPQQAQMGTGGTAQFTATVTTTCGAFTQTGP